MGFFLTLSKQENRYENSSISFCRPFFGHTSGVKHMKKFIRDVKADVEKQVVLLGIVTMIILTIIMINPMGN